MTASVPVPIPRASAGTVPPMVTVDCPVCASGEHDPGHVATDRWMGRPGRFRYARCRACGVHYLRDRPAPAAMAMYYPPEYVRRGRAPARLRDWLRRRDLAGRVALVRAQPGRRVLDVGCSNGAFLAAMRSAGWVVAGVEPTAWGAAEAKARGIPVWPTVLANAGLPAAAFDVATMWDVIEHLDHPAADLARLTRAIRPGGRLIVTTPVVDGWEARAYGTRWPGWDAPRHLVLFDRSALAALLERSGFRVIDVTWLSESYLISAMTIALAARAYLPRRLGDAWWTLVHLRLLRILAAPVFRRLDRAWGGCWVTVVAERAAPNGDPTGPVPG
jgi:2-polyprenyl-3-methyl-5-hydroxy-6-metoxy-1,4-benzoquinol methylase